jgi:tetratricopeptide (TPR) repeat protein
VLGSLASCLVAGLPAAAQDAHTLHRSPPIPLQALQRAIGLSTGIGQVSDGTFSASAEAQRYHDQGLAYLHSYVWIDAARSFNQALRLDAGLTMAHVGLSVALTELSHPAEARTEVERARAAPGKASEHVRWHVENRALHLAAEEAPSDKAKFAAWRDHLDRAIAALPSDVEFLLLRGIAEIGDPADRGQISGTSSIPYYQRALEASPGHPAALHYLAHAYENTNQLPAAIDHGRRYAALAPNVPHARHMYGHSLRRAGRVDEAIVEFRAADRLHRDAIARGDVAADADWHYAHNLDFLGLSLQYLGQMKAAEPYLKQSFALPSTLLVQMVNKREWVDFLIARGRLEEAQAAATILATHPHPVVQAMGHIEVGFIRLAQKRYADAAASSNAALKLMKQGGAGAGLIGTPLKRLQGEFLLRTAARGKGRAAMIDVAAFLRTAVGPDHWTQALFAIEAMTRTAREVGDWELADRLSRELMAHDAGYAGSHFERGMVAQNAGRAAEAGHAFAAARKLWARADADLPQMAMMKRR